MKRILLSLFFVLAFSVQAQAANSSSFCLDSTKGGIALGTATCPDGTNTVLDAHSSTTSITTASGTTGQRPASPVTGMQRYNSTTGLWEAYQGSSWVGLTLPATIGANGFTLKANSTATYGVEWTEAGIPTPGIASARWLMPPVSTNGLTAGNIVLNTISFSPVYVKTRTTFTDLGFATNTIVSGSYKVGVYANNAGTPTGTPVTNSTVTIGPFTTAAATQQTATFSVAITLNPGWYWLAVMADTTGTVEMTPAVNTGFLFGASDLTNFAGPRPTFAQTYTNGLPDMTNNSLTLTANTSMLLAGLKAQ